MISSRYLQCYSAAAIAAGLLLISCSRSPQEKEARFLNRGKAFLEKKEYSRATLEFLNASEAMPGDAEPYYQLGLALLKLGEPAKAAGALRRATELNPRHSAAQLKLADLLSLGQDRTNLEEARGRIEQVLVVAPENVEALDALALAELRLGSPEQATRELEKALEHAPARLESAVALARVKLLRKDAAGAERVLRETAARNPRSADAMLALGSLYLELGREAEALVEIERAVGADPANGAALATLAGLEFRSGEIDRAGMAYQKLSALPKKRYRPLYALFLFQTGRREAAIAELERLWRADPADRDARSRLVAAYFATGHSMRAAAILEAALKKNPRDTDALLGRSQLDLAAGRYTAAEIALRQVVHDQPDSGVAHYALARVYRAQGSIWNERQELMEALRIDPALLAARIELARALLHSKDSRGSLEVMNQALPAQRNTTAAIAARNWALLAAGENTELRKEIDRGLALERAPELLYQDALWKMSSGDVTGARTDAEELLGRNPEDLAAWRILGDAYSARHEMASAFERIRGAIARKPGSAPLHFMLARWLLAAGKTGEGHTALLEARAANPRYEMANLALAHLDLAEGRLEEARTVLSDAVHAGPRNSAARLMLGNVEEKAGNRREAIAHYRAVVELDRDNATALNDLAWLLVQDDPDAALVYAQRAGELAPENAAVEHTLGCAYYRKGIYETAVRYLKSAVSKGATARRRYDLGMAYLKAGERELGERTLQTALASDPTLAARRDP